MINYKKIQKGHSPRIKLIKIIKIISHLNKISSILNKVISLKILINKI